MNDRRRAFGKPQFSLRTLLVSAPLAAIALAWLAPYVIRRDKTEVTAYFEILNGPYLVYKPRPPNHEYETLLDRAPDDLLLAAIHSLSRDSRAWIEEKDDPLRWLRSNVHTQRLKDSDLVRIGIVNHAPTASSTAAEKEIIDQLLAAFSRYPPSWLEDFAAFCGGIRVFVPPQVEQTRNGWL